MRLKLPGILLALMLSLNAAAFDVRAVYVDHRTQVQTLPALEQLAKKAAEGGMNALVMEWEATFPFEDNATLCNRFAFSKSEVRDFINFCQRLGVDVIPLQNCFGHAEYILRHERYAGLREDAKDLSQVCPLRKEAAERFSVAFSQKSPPPTRPGTCTSGVMKRSFWAIAKSARSMLKGTGSRACSWSTCL